MQTRSLTHKFSTFSTLAAVALSGLLCACPYPEPGDTEGNPDNTSSGSTSDHPTSSSTAEPGTDTEADASSGSPTTGNPEDTDTGTDIDTGSGTSGTGNDTTGAPDPYCGDGHLDPGEECDAEIFCDHCVLDLTVFVTGEANLYRASDINGVLGADKICDNLARTAGLDGPDGDRRFRAWLSDTSASVVDRFIPAEGRYARVDGKEVAVSWADMLDGSLIFPPRIDMNGKPLYETVAWTATLPDGTYDAQGSCDNWSGSDGNAGVGDPEVSTSKWTNLGQMPCDGPELPLICVEQGKPAALVETMQPCTSDVECPWGTVCFPAIDNLGTLVCAAPCKTDAGCAMIAGGPVGAAPKMYCSEQGLCEPTLCNAVDPVPEDCNCQPWGNMMACFP